MASLLDTRLGMGLAIGAAMAIGVGAVVWLQRGAHQAAPAAPAATTANWDGPIGPGALPRNMPSNDAALARAGIGTQPLTDAEGHLVVDARLHTVFDTYLSPAQGGSREAGAAPLYAWLKSQLGQPALGQAVELAGAYRRYLQAEGELRARSRLPRLDPAAGLTDAQVDQMMAWQQTRAQLRERLLGTAVAQAWFGGEDADCSAAFADWRKQQQAPDAPDVDPNELRARRLHGARLAETRKEQAQSCAARLMGAPAQS